MELTLALDDSAVIEKRNFMEHQSFVYSRYLIIIVKQSRMMYRHLRMVVSYML